MKVHNRNAAVGKIGEVMDFRIDLDGSVAFKVFWYGEPRTCWVRAVDMEVVK